MHQQIDCLVETGGASPPVGNHAHLAAAFSLYLGTYLTDEATNPKNARLYARDGICTDYRLWFRVFYMRLRRLRVMQCLEVRFTRGRSHRRYRAPSLSTTSRSSRCEIDKQSSPTNRFFAPATVLTRRSGPRLCPRLPDINGQSANRVTHHNRALC